MELTLKLKKDKLYYKEVVDKAKELYKTEFNKQRMLEILNQWKY